MSRDRIRERMEQLSTEELQAIYREHDTTEYVPEAFGVVREILHRRGAEVVEPEEVPNPSESSEGEQGAQAAIVRSSGSGGFLGFRKMISVELIKAVYLLGALVIAGIGVLAIVRGQLGAGLLLIIGGNVLWRLLCEGGILLFSIHELLASIERKL